MQKNITIAIFTILSMVLMAIFYFLLDFDDIIYTDDTLVQKTKKLEQTKNKPSWNEKLAKVKTRDFYYPVNSLFIQINLKKKEIIKPRQPKESYRLLIDKNDRYSFFCIQKTLENFALPFIMIKEKDTNYIIINSYDTRKLQQVVDTLKQYNIKSNFKKVLI